MVEDDIAKKDNLLGLNNQLRGSNRYPNIYSNEDLCLKVYNTIQILRNCSECFMICIQDYITSQLLKQSKLRGRYFLNIHLTLFKTSLLINKESVARCEALLARCVALSCSVAREVERSWSDTNQLIQDIITDFSHQREEEEEEADDRLEIAGSGLQFVSNY